MGIGECIYHLCKLSIANENEHVNNQGTFPRQAAMPRSEHETRETTIVFVHANRQYILQLLTSPDAVDGL